MAEGMEVVMAVGMRGGGHNSDVHDDAGGDADGAGGADGCGAEMMMVVVG